MDTVLEWNSLLFSPRFCVLGTFCKWIDICPAEQRLQIFTLFVSNLLFLAEVDAVEATSSDRTPADVTADRVAFVRSVIGFLSFKKQSVNRSAGRGY